ncbi:hypothetical protein PSTT_14186 [Puccinia striiformis]|uniref:HAT C-terminal dimerisation domain-containing protein n=1 Tax=Puccinia striiformis TaxID=27350 RepID=A0A2S4UNB5_9BASI|nr:hypothetical protein PSTT_14186 [Puccinia striiformis]
MDSTEQQPSKDTNINGYQSDQSQLRRSSRAASVANVPTTLTPSSNSRPQTQKRRVAASSESAQSNTATGTTARNKKKSKSKKPRQHTSSGAPSKKGIGTGIPKKGTKTQRKKSTADKAGEAIADEYDYDQDSEEGSIEIKDRAEKNNKKDEDDFAEPTEYFFPPFFKEGDKGKDPLNFKCRWCLKDYRGHNSTDGNLTTHRDGSNQAGRNANGCPNRHKAKAAGIKLPPSVAEKRLLNTKQTSISTFLQPKQTFVVRVLNQIIMIWQIRQALAWARVEDPALRAAFLYANNKAVLYGKRWSADESKRLYSMLKTTVFDDLKKLDTKFTLIHDVWTTKGNRFAFIGAAVAHVDSNWEYVVRHLALKMIPWKHFGHLLARPIVALLKKGNLYQKLLAQTTDSGSNNNTMATLIVNAGLAALSLKTLPPGKTKKSVLGFFPVLGKLSEEDETDLVVPAPAPEVEVLVNSLTITVEADDLEADRHYDTQSDYGNADDEGSDIVSDDEEEEEEEEEKEKESTVQPTKHAKTRRLKELTDKLDVVIKQITRSAAQRASFDRMAEELKVKVSPLIAGYGIRWNIKYQSHRKAIQAREVIDRLLKDDQEHNQSLEFGDVWFSPRDWKEIDNLNRELELTSDMEGDSATGAHVVPKYLQLKDQLSQKLARSEETDTLYPMYHAMLKRIDKYLSEAMACETLILATIMHPCYRMHIFELGFGPESSEVKNCLTLLKQRFQIYKDELKNETAPMVSESEVAEIERPSTAAPLSLMERLASRTATKPAAHENEIEAFLKVDISFKKDAIVHKTTPLQWWKRNTSIYPALSRMARAYLSASGSSCAVERLFSAAADVCTSNRGRLLPSTMSRCVSSLMWLREEVPLSGDFQEAGRVLKAITIL